MDMFDGDFNATTSTAAVESTKDEGIAPVFIRQILEAPDDSKFWGMQFSMHICVAIVRSIETASTRITYLLEDSTGRIEGLFWLDEGGEGKAPDIMINNYAKVFCSMRSQGGAKTLAIFKMLPVLDPNEICTHALEVLYTRYKCEAYSKNEPSVQFGSSKMEGANDLGLEGKSLAVFEAIKNNISDAGISRDELKRKFAHMNSDELNSTIDFMISEGHVYSTSDSNHFRITE